jgi:hypothetical protein
MRSEWEEDLARSGLAPVAPSPPAGDEAGAVTCPACGTTAPLENGTCRDCGLTLA